MLGTAALLLSHVESIPKCHADIECLSIRLESVYCPEPRSYKLWTRTRSLDLPPLALVLTELVSQRYRLLRQLAPFAKYRFGQIFKRLKGSKLQYTFRSEINGMPSLTSNLGCFLPKV